MKSMTERLRDICYDKYYPTDSETRRRIRRAVLAHAVFGHHTLVQLPVDDPSKYPPIRVVLPYGSAEGEHGTPPLTSMLYQHAYAAAVCDHAQSELLQAIRRSTKEAIVVLKRDPSHQFPPFGEEPSGDNAEKRSSSMIPIRFYSRDAFIPSTGANNDTSTSLPHGSSKELVSQMPEWKAQFVFYYPPLGVYFTSIQQLFLVHDAMSRGWCDSICAPMYSLFGYNPKDTDGYAVFAPMHGESTASLDAAPVNAAINYVLCAFLEEIQLPLVAYRSLDAVPNGFIPEFCKYFTTKITAKGHIHVKLGERAVPVAKFIVSKAKFEEYPEAEQQQMIGGRVPILSTSFRDWVVKRGLTTREHTQRLWEGKANLAWFFSASPLGKRQMAAASSSDSKSESSDPPAKRARSDSESESEDADDLEALLLSGRVVEVRTPPIVCSDDESGIDLVGAAEAMVAVGNTERMDVEADNEVEEEEEEPYPATLDIISDLDIYENIEANNASFASDVPESPVPLSPMPESQLGDFGIDLDAQQADQCIRESPFGSPEEEDKQRQIDRGTPRSGMKYGPGDVIETDSEAEDF